MAIAAIPCGAGPEAYEWLVIVSAIAAFVMAFGIGANDVANAFASSVGSGALKLWQAVVVASIFEFLGAVLVGAQVTSTIRSGIVDPAYYEDDPQVLMLGMFAALVGAGVWLIFCSRVGVTVSTTHSIVGGIIGFSLVAAGAQSVDWRSFGLIVASWFVSPTVAAIVALIVFVSIRHFVLRRPNSLDRAYMIYPVLIALTFAINIFFLVYKGVPSLNWDQLEVWKGVLIALGVGAGIGIIVRLTVLPYLRRRIEARDSVLPTVAPSASSAAAGSGDDGKKPSDAAVEMTPIPSTVASSSASMISAESTADAAASPAAAAGTPDSASASGVDASSSGFLARSKSSLLAVYNKHKDRLTGDAMVNEAMANAKVEAMHARAEAFDNKTEAFFTYLQVVTACFDSFAHGANDVSNAIAPLAAIVGIYSTGAIDSESPVPVWTLLLGAFGIVFGLALYGYKVIKVLGMTMVKITPSRGFSIELATAFVATVASMIGMPISTTHCQVGATVAVGLVEGNFKKAEGFNVRVLVMILVSWVVTMVFSGLVSASIFSLMHFAP